jgi:hypothetical protein
MDELQQQVIEQLPEDGSAISFDEWKDRVAVNVSATALVRTANKYNRGMVNYHFAQGSGGAVILMVSRIGHGG